MKTEVKYLPKSIAEISLFESADALLKYRKTVIDNFAKNASIKGFRKWANIPEDVIVKHFWEEHIMGAIIDQAIDILYKKAVKKHNIIPVSEAKLHEIKTQSPLDILIHVEVFPEVEVDKKYSKIKLKKSVVKVDDKEVDVALADIQKRFTKFEKVNDWKYKVQSWDKVVIDTEGFDKEWKLLETTVMTAYPLTIGSNIMVPGFESGLIWTIAWEDIELKIKFPKDYHHKDFAKKDVKFNVKILDIETSVTPEFTPEFIKWLRWKELDLKWFKELIKSEIMETKEQNARMDDENTLIEKLLKVTKLDIWDNLLKRQTEKVFEETKQNITSQWAKVGDYLESLKLSEEEYIEKNVKPIALKRLQSELIVHRLYEMEKIVVADSDLNIEIEKIMERYESKDVKKKLKDLYKPWTQHYEELRMRHGYRILIDSFFN